jgi:hypothetical protein
MVVRPNKNMQADSQYRGRNRFKSMLDGISNKTYGTKKMTKAVLYSLLTSFNSLVRPKTLALAMLTLCHISLCYVHGRKQSHLSKKASKYMMQRNGMTRQSILFTKRLSVVCGGHLTCKSSSIGPSRGSLGESRPFSLSYTIQELDWLSWADKRT